MFRPLLSPRTLIGVVICLCLIIAGSLWCYWHVRRASKAEYQRSVEFSEQLDNKPAVSEGVDVPTQIGSADFHDTPTETGETVRSLSRVAGGGNLQLTAEQMQAYDIPAGVEVIDMDTAGFDPYEELGIQ